MFGLDVQVAVILVSCILCNTRERHGCAVLAMLVVWLLLINDYNNIQSNLKQYIDYNQLMNIILNTDVKQLYTIQKVPKYSCDTSIQVDVAVSICIAQAENRL